MDYIFNFKKDWEKNIFMRNLIFFKYRQGLVSKVNIFHLVYSTKNGNMVISTNEHKYI